MYSRSCVLVIDGTSLAEGTRQQACLGGEDYASNLEVRVDRDKTYGRSWEKMLRRRSTWRGQKLREAEPCGDAGWDEIR